MNEVPRESGRIDRLKNYLNSRAVNYQPKDVRTELKNRLQNVKSDWGDGTEVLSRRLQDFQQKSVPKRLFVLSIVFFICAALLAGIILLRGANIISGNNINIAITGPVTTEGGKELPFQVAVENNNNTELELVDLVIRYPEGTRVSDNLSEELNRHRESLGNILPHGVVARDLKATLFGEEGEKKTIVVAVEYRTKGSNALFSKEKDYEVTVSSAPMVITVEGLKEISSNQLVELALSVTSNSTTVLQDVLLKAEYPFGFTPESASPKAAYGNNVWRLGDLKGGATQKIVIRGRLDAQNGDTRVFRFSTGLQKEDDEREIQAVFALATHEVAVAKPFLGLSMSVNGNTANEVAVPSGRQTEVKVTWINNLPERVIDAEIQVKLVGDAFLKTSVQPGNGFYRSADNVIVWTKDFDDRLSVLNPGDSGDVTFTLTPSGASLQNPSITVTASAKGKRAGESGVPESIDSIVKRTLKVASDVSLTARALYGTGPFKNSGPLPPKADQETTYTVVWTITNSSNTIQGARVSATLPPYMRLVGSVNPSQEKVSVSGGKVVWQAGEVKSSKGSTPTVREVAFQIALTPSLTQVGQAPTLIGEAELIAEDSFAKTQLRTTRPALTTYLSTDPTFNLGTDDKVVQ